MLGLRCCDTHHETIEHRDIGIANYRTEEVDVFYGLVSTGVDAPASGPAHFVDNQSLRRSSPEGSQKESFSNVDESMR